MRKILLLLLLLPFGKIIAQKSYVQTADEKFAGLDKSKIATNILYDRVVGQANLTTFGKIDNEKTTPDRFIQGFYEMKLANYKNSPSLEVMNVYDAIKKYNESKKVPLGVLDYAFNSIDSTAKDKYLTHQLQMVVALQMEKLEVGKLTFLPSNSLHFGNQESTIASVKVDFGENNQKAIFDTQNTDNQL